MSKGASTPAGAASIERIIATATRIFAERGFAGARVRDIAAEAGLNVATVAFHIGTKEDLYRLVFERLKQRENAALGPVFARTMNQIGDATPDIVAIATDLADAYIDWFATEPHAAALWVRRWLGGDTHTAPVDSEYNLDFYHVAEQALAAAAAEGHIRDGDHHLALKGFIWMTYGRQIDRLLETPEQRDRYRAFTTDYIHSLLRHGAPTP